MFSGLSTGDIVVLLFSLVFSIVLHEMMHAFTARWLGDTTAEDAGRISLNPLRHIDPFTTILLPVVSYLLFHVPFLAAKPVPFNPNRVKWGEMGAALVGVAGPLTNLALAVIASLMIRTGFDGNVLAIFMQINIVLFVFNMIPFPPLDGSRLLYALAPEPIQEVMARIESAGIVAIMVFMLIFFSFLSPIILNIDNWIYNFLLR